MNFKPVIDVLLPAYNEEKAVGKVLDAIPKELTRHRIVCDNASTDQTASVAKQHGAVVVHQPLKGYGNNCLKGMQWISEQEILPDIVVFLDADYSDYPEELPKLIEPILYQKMDLVLGSRVLGSPQKGSMTPVQKFGNWLSTRLIKLFWNYTFTDLGPFRAILYDKLLALKMKDPNYGWTVEMQIKAAKMKLSCMEVAVQYRPRIGVSKVSGTIKGTIGAGYKILLTIFRYGIFGM